jgi:hypothetical protein
MGDFLEAILFLLPSDAGGRPLPIEPRSGSYRPLVGSMRARFIEGPPAIEPGGSGRVVVELEAVPDSELVPGSELPVIEDDCLVGLLTVMRRFRMVA